MIPPRTGDISNSEQRSWTPEPIFGAKLTGYRLRTYRAIASTTPKLDPFMGCDTEWLIFDWSRPERVAGSKTAGDRDLAISFSKLKNEADVLAFAKRHGALGFCRHGLPSHHPYLNALGAHGRVLVSRAQLDNCAPLRIIWDDKSRNPAESIAAWLAWAENAALLLRVAAGLRKQQISREDRAALTSPSAPFKAFFESDRELSQSLDGWKPGRLLGLWINVWLRLSRVWLCCDQISPTQFKLTPSAQSPMLGLIALQLAAVVCDAKAVRMCSIPSCKETAIATRIGEGRNNYCPEHRGPGRIREGKRRFAERERQAKELFSQGLTNAQVVERLYGPKKSTKTYKSRLRIAARWRDEAAQNSPI